MRGARRREMEILEPYVKNERIKNKLLVSAMEGDWNEVVNLYKQHPEVHKAKDPKSGDTALHIALLDGKEDVVEQLVELSSSEALTLQNVRGNTPLHFAASLGSARLCNIIARKDSQVLIGLRNHDSECPLFLAALYGYKDAFLCLHSLCGSTDESYSYCRRADGETILHAAINGDYFDLAFQIIQRFGKLVNYVNERGISPLHLLATKPLAFRSGCHIGWKNRIIYHCTHVDELTEDSSHDQLKPSEDRNNPENYNTCINFFLPVLNMYHVLVRGAKGNKKNDEEADAKGQDNWNKKGSRSQAHGHQLFPINYATCFDAFKLISKAMLIILGLGSREIRKIQEQKEKHTWSVQIMNELLKRSSMYKYDDSGEQLQHLSSHNPDEISPCLFLDYGNIEFRTGSITSPDQQFTPQMPSINSFSEAKQSQGEKSDWKINGDAAGEEMKNSTEYMGKRETPILIAAKNGITEMVERILELFPAAIHDMNTDKKNIVLLAVENKQTHIYQLLLQGKFMRERAFRKVDSYGNSALHLAAGLGNQTRWLLAGSALQLQWECKWYQFVKESMPSNMFVRYNKRSETPEDIFVQSHKELVIDGVLWLYHASNSCSFAAALVTTVAFASSATLPGGVDDKTGSPTLEHQPAFMVFAIASLVALCFSTISLVAFLSILTSRYRVSDFTGPLPRKFLLALTTLLGSIVAMLVSFCSSHFFLLKDRLQISAYPLYAVVCLGTSLFVVFQFPIYFDFLKCTISELPPRSYIDDEIGRL